MKKTVLALAAIAASSAAFAQSSVTLFGVVDASVESVKGDNTVTRVSSDNLASSRIGFKGTEDLGGGLKANFFLDSSFKTDTGATGDSTRFFGRSAWVGLAGGFGEARIGRQDSLIGAQSAAALGTQAYDELVVAQTLGGVGYRRLDNALTYVAPTLVPGLALAAQYTTKASGTEAYADNSGRGYGLSANYANGPLAAGISYIHVNTDVRGDIENTGVLVFGSYDLGVAKLTAYYNEDSRDNAAGVSYSDRQVFGLKAAVPVAQGVTLSAGYAAVKNANSTSTSFNAKSQKDDGADIFTLKAQYDLSKRTALYALFTQVNNDDAANLSVSGATTSAGKSSRGLAVGVRHNF
ncbi:MAG: porin [Burkholderiales bacterium]|nr:porin [Burkholderiales bacterium]MBH2015273.1 porin [Burkholderiales bacterium]